jgi:uncharacterized protein (TIGR00369 family)
MWSPDVTGQPRFPVRNPEFREVVAENFSRQAFMATLGARIVLIEPGEVHIEVPFSRENTQQNGYLHAGVITSVADSACGYAAFSLSPPGHDVLAVEFKISLLAPARAPLFRACARVLRTGRITTSFCEIFGLTGEEREMVATMLSTVISRPVAGGWKQATERDRS